MSVCYQAQTLIIASLVLPAVPAFAQEDEWQLRDVWRIKFTGNDSFSAEDIRQSLALDVPVQRTVDITQPIENFRRTVAERVKVGYQSKGYGDVEVAIKPGDNPAQPLTIHVREGLRYICGDITIKSDADVLRKLLQLKPSKEKGKKEDDDDSEGKVWKRGKPAVFSDEMISGIKTRVAEILEREGYHFPKFDIELLRDRSTATASLNVNIETVGPKQPIGQVEFTGLSRHSEQDILDYLKLPEQLYATKHFSAGIVKDLLASGRFVIVKTRTDAPFGPDHAVTLHVDVIEYEDVPPLSEKLNDRQQIMMKLAEWLSNPKEHGEDLAIRIEMKYSDEVTAVANQFMPQDTAFPPELKPANLSADVYLGSSGGGIARLKFLDIRNNAVVDVSVLLHPQGTGIISWSTQSKWITDSLTAGSRTTIQLVGQEPDENGRRFSIKFAVGLTSDTTKPLETELIINPCALIDAVQAVENANFIVGEKLTEFRYSGGVVKIDTATGALRELIADAPDFRLEARSGKGLLQSVLAEVTEETREWNNGYSADHPTASLITWVATWIEEFAEKIDRPLTPDLQLAMTVLKDEGVITELGDKLSDWSNENNFSIPAETSTENDQGLGSTWYLHILKSLVPTGSTAHRLSSVMIVSRQSGKMQPLWTLLREICREDHHGPLTCWLTGMAVPAMRATVSRLGLERLDANALPPEVVTIVESPCVLGNLMRRFVSIIRTMEDDRARLLATMFVNAKIETEKPDSSFRGFDIRAPLALIRSHPSDDTNEIVKDLLLLAWRMKYHDYVKERLTAWTQKETKPASVFRSVSDSRNQKDRKGERKRHFGGKEIAIPGSSEPYFQNKKISSDKKTGITKAAERLGKALAPIEIPKASDSFFPAPIDLNSKHHENPATKAANRIKKILKPIEIPEP